MTKNSKQNSNSPSLYSLFQQQRKEIDDLKLQLQDTDNLKAQVKTLTESVEMLKKELLLVNNKLEVSSHVNNVLSEQVDNLQQYSRRYSILLENVPKKVNEQTNDVEREVKKILTQEYKVDPNKLETEFDKAHRLGKVTEDNKQTIIIRFKSHSFRSNLYVGRKHSQGQGQGHRNMPYKLRVALTEKRRKLLSEAQRKIDGNPKVAFAFANVNGDIKIRTVDQVNNKQVFDIKSSLDIDILLETVNSNVVES